MLRKLIGHTKTILKHKAIVFRECAACGFFWRGLVHDLSKFSPSEFIPSVKHYQGDRSPITEQKKLYGWSSVWLHHKGRNRHHWEYWTDFGRGGRVKPAKIPYKYIVEMICDWIAAGQVYKREQWTQEEPWNFYHRHSRYLELETEELVVKLLRCIKQEGLDGFHKMARALKREAET